MYDLRRLRSLCAIADHGSLTAAADALTFTQPAVSQHLAALEAEVGAPLVTRSRGGAELTDAGRLLVEHARAALDRLALAEVQVSDLVAHEQRRVRLAGHSSSLTRLIPLAVADLRRRLPDAEVTIREAGPPARSPRCGAATSTSRSRSGARASDAPADVEERLLLEESMYAVVPRAHPLAGESELELAGLRDDAWIQGPSATSPGLIRELCRDAGFEPRIAFESDDPLATRGIVAAGLAVSLVPSLTKDDTARDRSVRVLPLRDPPRRRVVAATMAGGRTTQATRRDGRVARPRRSPDRPGQPLASRAWRLSIIDGKAIAQAVRAEVKRDVADCVAQGNLSPGLATVLVGDDPASAVYVGNKQKASAEVGIVGLDHRLPPGRLPRGGRDAACASSPPPSACPASCSSSRRRRRSTARR